MDNLYNICDDSAINVESLSDNEIVVDVKVGNSEKPIDLEKLIGLHI